MSAVMWVEPGGEIRWQPQLPNGERLWVDRGYSGDVRFGTYWATKPKGKHHPPSALPQPCPRQHPSLDKEPQPQKGLETTMTSIKDLELRIKSSESTLERLRAELTELKAQTQEQPEQESLLGRWATHPEYGRGIIASDKPDTFKEVRFTIRNDEFTDGADQLFVRFDDLTLDPETLTTEQDFDKAPEGTIVEELDRYRTVRMKVGDEWRPIGENDYHWSHDMIPSRVIRWGNGK